MAVQLNASVNQSALIKSIQNGVSAYNQRFASQNQINLQINQKAFSQPLGRITGDIKDFNAAIAASNARVIAFGASTAVLGTAIRGFKSLADATIEVEKNLADINRILNLSTENLQKYAEALFDVAKITATSFDQASKAMLEFSRQGLSAEETLNRTNDALMLTRLAGMDAADSVNALTATVNGFADSGITTTQVLNKLIAVEQAFAVSARDLSQGLSRTGQAAQEAGVDIDQLNALIATAQQKTARGGAVIGNALKTIFTRLGRAETLSQLENFNIAVRDVQGNVLPAVSILQNFADTYSKLSDVQKSYLSEQVAGVYQVNILKALISDLNSEQSIYNKALLEGANATNQAEIANAKLNQTLSALLQQASTGITQLSSNIGKITFEPLVKYAAETANSVIETFNDILTGEGLGSDFAKGFLKGVRNLLGGPAALAAFFTLFKLIQNSFVYLTQALPQIAGITTEAQNRKNIESAILQIMARESNESKALAGYMGNQTAQAQLLLNLAKQQTAQYHQQTQLAQKLAASLSISGVSVGKAGLQVSGKASGFIPNAVKNFEKQGARKGGYSPGSVIAAPKNVGGVMNTAEEIKYVPGFAQPFINPPEGSRAGRVHRKNAIKETGVDPYGYLGFIPNFAGGGNPMAPIGKVGEAETLKLIRRDPKYTSIGNLSKRNPHASFDFIAMVNGEKTLIDSKNVKNFGQSKYVNEVAKKIFNSISLGDSRQQILDYSESPVEIYIPKSVMEKSRSLKNLDKQKKFTKNIDQIKSLKKKLKPKSLDKIIFKSVIKTFANGFIPNFADSRLTLQQYAAQKGKIWNNSLLENSSFLNAAVDKGVSELEIKNLTRQYAGTFTAQINKLNAQKIGASPVKQKSFDKMIDTLTTKQRKLQTWRYKGTTEQRQKEIRANRLKAIQEYSWNGRPIRESIIPWDKTIKDYNGDATAFGKDYEQIVHEKMRARYGARYKTSTELKLSGTRDKDGNIISLDYADVDGAILDNLGRILSWVEIKAQSKEGQMSFERKDILDKFARAYAKNIKGGQQLGANPKIRGRVIRQRFDEGFIPNFAHILGKNKDNIAIRSVTSPLDKQGNRQRGSGAVKNAILAAIDMAKKNGLSKISADIISEPSLNAFKKYFGTAKRGKNVWNVSEFKNVFGGFIPNFADMSKVVRGRNIFQIKWMKDMAKKRGLNLEDPEVMKKLGAEFAKKYPNEQLMMGFGGGFIPNFAYKQAVMDLEERMSGSDAIYSETPFPHIRNKSQPTFSSAIADHGGLKNALQDSINNQAKEKLIDGGFIPNFAPRIGSSMKLRTAATTPGMGGGGVPIKESKALIKAMNDNIKLYQVGKLSLKALKKANDDLMKAKNLDAASTKKLSESNRRSISEAQKLKRGALTSARIFNRQSAGRSAQVAAQQQSMQQSLQPSADRSAAADEKKLQKKQLRAQRLSSFGTTLAFAGPMVAGLVEQSLYGDKKRSELSESQRFGKSFLSTGLTAMSTGASIGAAFGPWGIAIGAATGALLGLVKATKDSSLTLEEYAQKIDESMQKQIAGMSSYSDSMQKLQQAYESGDEKGIQKAQSELAASISGLGAENLAKVRGKSGKEIQDLIDETRKSAEANKSLLTSSEAISGGGDELSFFEKFKERATEAVFSMGSYLSDVFTKFGDFVLDTFKNLFEKVSDVVSNFLITLKDGWMNLGTFIGAQFNMLGYAIQEKLYKITGGLMGEQNNQFYKDQQKAIADAAAANLSNIGASLAGTFKKVVMNSSPLLIGLRMASEGADYLEESGGQRKIFSDRYKIQDIAAKYAGAGGLKSLDAYNQIFGEDELRNEQIYTQLSALAASADSRERKEIISTIKDTLVNRGLDPEMVDAFARQLEEFSKAGNYKGQVVLAKFEEFITTLRETNGEAARVAAEEGEAVGDFKKIRDDIRKSVDEYVKKSQEDQISVQGQIARRNLFAQRRQEMVGATGKPYEVARLEYANNLLGIEDDLAEKRRKNSEELMSAFGSEEFTKKLEAGQLGEYKTLMENIKDKPLQDQTSALRGFIEGEGGASVFASPDDQQAYIKMLEERSRTDELAVKSAQEATATEKLRYQYAQQRLNDERNYALQFKNSILSMSDQADLMLAQLGREIPTAFADGMTNALSQVVDGTKSIGDAFQDVAIDFGKMIMNAVMKAAIYKGLSTIAGGLFSQEGGSIGFQSGGVIRANNGMFVDGSGSGDRYPAMLENGEYVLNRNAVAAMGGKSNLDKLNFSKAPRFASGGGFSMQPELDKNNEYTGDLLMDQNNVGKINEEDFSAYAYEEADYFKKMKEKAMEKTWKDVQKKYEKGVKRAQLIGAIVGAVGSAFLGAGLSSLANSAANTAAKTGSQAAQAVDSGSLQGATEAGTKAIESFKAGEITGTQLAQSIAKAPSDFNLAGEALTNVNKGFLGMGSGMKSLGQQFSSRNIQPATNLALRPEGGFSSIFQSLGSSAVSTGANRARGSQQGGYIGFNSGGFVPYGSHLSDTIPALLTGGEYVMNNNAVKRYGLGTMNAMNSGSYNSGGSVSNESVTNNDNTNSSVSNSTNISINVDRSGKSVYGKSPNSYEQTDIQMSKTMARQINQIVMKTMSNEKRYGGQLYQ